jgi:hypothetical protein
MNDFADTPMLSTPVCGVLDLACWELVTRRLTRHRERRVKRRVEGLGSLSSRHSCAGRTSQPPTHNMHVHGGLGCKGAAG